MVAPRGVIVFPPRPLLRPAVPALQTNVNLAMLIARKTQQIQRTMATAAERANKEAAAKAKMMAQILSLRNS